jgi:Flp pilus assembly pilin Flp
VQTPPENDRPRPRSLLRDRRGAVSTEYVVLVGTMGLAFVASMLTVGPRLVKDYVRARDITASPLP